MKKTVPILAIMILLIQSLVAPVIAVADAMSTGAVPEIQLTSIKGQLVNDSNQMVGAELPLKAAENHWLQVTGDMMKETEEGAMTELSLSDNLGVNGQASEVTNNQGQVIGHVQIEGQRIRVQFAADVTGNQNFSFALPVIYQGTEVQQDSVKIYSSLGETSVDFTIFQEEVITESTEPSESAPIESSESSEEAIPTSETKEERQNKQAAKKNSRLIDNNEIQENIITKIDWKTYPDAEEKPTVSSQFKLSFEWALPEALEMKWLVAKHSNLHYLKSY